MELFCPPRHCRAPQGDCPVGDDFEMMHQEESLPKKRCEDIFLAVIFRRDPLHPFLEIYS